MSDRAVIAILVFLLIVVGIIVVRYDEEVRALFGRLERFRADRKGFESTFKPPPDPVNNTPGAAPAIEDEGESPDLEKDDDAERIDINAETNIDHLNREMIRAIFAEDPDRAKEAREKIREIASDPIDSAKADATYDAASFDVSGSPEDFQRLRDRAKDPRITAHVESLAGVLLENVKRYPEAAEAFERATEAATEPEFRARMVARRAEVLINLREADKATQEVEAALSSESDPETRARLWRALAKTFEARKQYLNQAAALQEAREHEPNDADLCFRIAWALSQDGRADVRGMAIHFYTLAIYLDPKEGYALNNLGWEYSKADLSILATSYYKQATEAGNTLAMANLAGIKLRAGLADDAEELLTRARQEDKVHENVAGVQSDVTSARSTQGAKAQELEKNGAQLADFLSKCAQAQLLDKPSSLPEHWQWVEGEAVSISFENPTLICTWQEGKTKMKLEAEVRGRSGWGRVLAMGTRYSYAQASQVETDWEEKRTALLVIKPGDEAIHLALFNDDSTEFRRLLPTG